MHIPPKPVDGHEFTDKQTPGWLPGVSTDHITAEEGQDIKRKKSEVQDRAAHIEKLTGEVHDTPCLRPTMSRVL